LFVCVCYRSFGWLSFIRTSHVFHQDITHQFVAADLLRNLRMMLGTQSLNTRNHQQQIYRAPNRRKLQKKTKFRVNTQHEIRSTKPPTSNEKKKKNKKKKKKNNLVFVRFSCRAILNAKQKQNYSQFSCEHLFFCHQLLALAFFFFKIRNEIFDFINFVERRRRFFFTHIRKMALKIFMFI
jgi:N-acetylmuramoyl-L-alanine amidase CwlA